MNDSQLIVELGDRSYPVLFRHDAVEELAGRVSALASTHRVFVISDENVAPLHLPAVREALQAAQVKVLEAVVPAGEGSKSVTQAQALWDVALSGGIDRRTPVLALGGGVVGDLAGFVAATLLRGLPFIQAPTSLMAQVDASVGGKNGLNHAAGKNLIGTFHQPHLVFADSAWLATLPAREYRSGLAEVVKHAVLAAPKMLDDLATGLVWSGTVGVLRRIVARAVAIKASIVAADEIEAGLRMVLNLGHTLGHAFEAEAAFGGLTHGEAVSLGLVAALEMSERLSGLQAVERHRVEQVLAFLGLPTDWRAHFGPAVLARVGVDKKVRGDRVNLVLMRQLGEPEVVPVRWNDLVASLDALVAEKPR